MSSPFESEAFMPPENNFKPTVIFFTGRVGKVDVDKEWLDIGKDSITKSTRDFWPQIKV